MIIKQIINLCKKAKNMGLFDIPGEQWITDGHALYPLFDLPRFSLETLCKTYDITQKQQDNLHLTINTDLPDCYCYDDSKENENECEQGPVNISCGKDLLIPFSTSTGIKFVESKYFSPFSDTNCDYIKLYERYTPTGEMYFAVKNGLVLTGIIVPENHITPALVEGLEALHKQCEIALFNNQRNDMLEKELEYMENSLNV